MPLSQQNVNPATPMGANLVSNGATVRVWAPVARAVHLRLNAGAGWTPDDANLLVKGPDGNWSGFVEGAKDGDLYRFHIVGDGGAGLKRDPYARELGPGFPHCDCILRDPLSFSWHDEGWTRPRFNDLIVYQFHIGTYYAADAQGRDRRPGRGAKVLDVLDRIEYLRDLGVNAIQPLPIVEFSTEHSLGYNGTDYFSPESDYCVSEGELPPYVNKLNALLAARGRPPVPHRQLVPHINQVKALIDICHVYGLAVILDVVYNHAGGDFGDESLYFLDRESNGNNNNSLYFTDQGWAGGLIFAFWKREVRRFLIDNANFFADEYHVDGFRYDEVTVIATHGGWGFCQELNRDLHARHPQLPEIAECWDPHQAPVLRAVDGGGAGFDAVWQDGLRGVVRSAIEQAAHGREAFVNLDAIRDHLYPVPNFGAAWKAVQHLENHDLVYAGHGDRVPRIAALGDPSNARSIWARSRARVANGLLLTAPGMPMLFMGQEFLEDKPWSDTPAPNLLIYWDGLKSDKVMQDFLRFMQELNWHRRRQPALRGEAINVFHVHNDNRVIAFHRWIEGTGRDVLVVATLNESPQRGYRIGFPSRGRWLEIFNSDVYDDYVNPRVVGNGGSVQADGPPMHGLPSSASIVLPANSIVLFARDAGD